MRHSRLRLHVSTVGFALGAVGLAFGIAACPDVADLDGTGPLASTAASEAAAPDVAVAYNDGSSFASDASVGDASVADAFSSACNADLATSADHCGLCGHSCRGSTCAGGLCAAQPIATQQSVPQRLAIGRSDLVWTLQGVGAGADGRGIYGAPLDGGSPRLLVAEINSGFGLAVRDEGIYWTNWFSSNALNVLSADAAAPRALVTGFGGSGYLVVDDARATWIAAPLENTGPSYVVSSQLDGGSVVKHASALDGGGAFTSVALGQSRVYWTETMAGRVVRSALDGGDRVTVAEGQSGAGVMDLDGDVLYWSTLSGTASIQRASVNGGAPEVFLDGRGKITRIRHDATHVYFVETESSIYRMTKDRSELVALVRAEQGIHDIAVDDQWLYYAASRGTGSNGVVMRVAK